MTKIIALFYETRKICYFNSPKNDQAANHALNLIRNMCPLIFVVHLPLFNQMISKYSLN